MARRTTVLAVLVVAALLGGCGKKDDPPSAARSPGGEPAAAQVTPDGPVGLYVRAVADYARAAAGQPAAVQQSVWYFAPDGTVHDTPKTGFSEKDVPGARGTRTLKGSSMTVAWGNRSRTAPFTPEKGKGPGFGWNLAVFRPAKPAGPGRSLAGTWGDGGAPERQLVLRPDGTYVSDGWDASEPPSSGTWRAAGYLVTLSDASGQASRRVAFPLDEAQLYFGGRVLQRR
jgi:hypothetical protein